MKQHLSALTRKSQEIYSSLLLSERVYFIEFLVCISNTISEQIPFLNEIIEPFLTSWSSPNGNITLTLSSPTNIFSLLQIFNVTAEQEEIAKVISISILF